MKNIILILMVLLMSSCSKTEGVITSKIEEPETYWVYRYKQSEVQLDSLSYFHMKKLNPKEPSFYAKPRKYFFYINGEEKIEVSSYTFNHYYEGNVYKEL